MTAKILASIKTSDTKIADILKKNPFTKIYFSIQKIKNFAKLLFENTIFQTFFLIFSSFYFSSALISIGPISYTIPLLISSLTTAIFLKYKSSDFIYDLSTTDSYIREKFFKKTNPWFTQINENIFLGAIPLKNLNHEKVFKEKNITSILSIIEEKETLKETIFTTPIELSYWKSKNFSHLHIPIKDRHSISINNLQKAANFINDEVSKNKKVYVHCLAGRSRSAMAIIAYFLKYKKMKLNEAFDFIKAKRNVVLINSSQRKALNLFNASLSQ